MNKKSVKKILIYIIFILVFLVVLCALVVFLLIKKGEADYNQDWRNVIAETTGYKWSDQTKQIKIIENLSETEEAWDGVLHIQVPQDDINTLQKTTNFTKCDVSKISWEYDLAKSLKDYPIPSQKDIQCLYSYNISKNTARMTTFLFNSGNGEIWIISSHLDTSKLPQTTPPNVETTKNIYDRNGKLLYEVYDR